MPSLQSFAAALVGLLGAVNGLVVPRDAGSYGTPKAYLYFMQNSPDGASIVAVDTANQGQGATVTPTGGKGATFVTATGGTPINDTLNSQGAMTLEGNILLSVNAGSNTVSMFKIDPAQPLYPKLVGKPTDTLGDFPVSVAYSTVLKQACILNGGTRNSVACFNVDVNKGLTPNGPARSLNETLKTPPVFGTGLVSQVIFSPDLSYMLAVSKGVSGGPGTYYVWPIKDGSISQQPVVSHIPDMINLFGLAFEGTNSNKLFVADTAFGGSVVTIGSDLKPTEVLHQNEHSILRMPCWSTYSYATKLFYSSDAGNPHFGVYNPSNGVFEGLLNVTQSLGGIFDTLLDPRDNKTLYFLSGVNALAAIDTVTKETTSILTISGNGIGTRQFWDGLAMYVAK